MNIIRKKWNRLDTETAVFLVFLLGMAVYYGWRMFALTPWYDELYTYYYFISRGPVYAAIHWSLPNNHVGYSTISACLGIFGNSAVALRGVSWLCSLGSLVLLFRIGRKLFGSGMALVPVFLFAGLNLVNNLAVQGRGYALVTFCYLTALWELLYIVAERRDRIVHYVLFGLALVTALWAIPSSVYMVVPVCLIGGWTALLGKDYKRLKRLIATSAASALCTVGLYAVIWLAIGSNLLSKTEDSACYGMGHIHIILHAPLEALWTGIKYMLDTPYIQSVPRNGFMGQFLEWLQTLFGTHFTYLSVGHKGIGYAVIFIASVILLIITIAGRLKNREYVLISGGIAENGTKAEAGQKRKAEAVASVSTESVQKYDIFTEWYLLFTIILLPLFLIIQCTLPYYRVFSFAGVLTALLITWLLRALAVVMKKALKKTTVIVAESITTAIKRTVVIICAALCFGGLWVSSQPYSMRDELIRDAYGQNHSYESRHDNDDNNNQENKEGVESSGTEKTVMEDVDIDIEDIDLEAIDIEKIAIEDMGTIAVTDCDQEYLLLYLYGIGEERVTRQIQDADMVLIDKYLLGRNYDYREAPEEWKFYLTQEEIPMEYLEQEMEPVYENWQFVLYVRR